MSASRSNSSRGTLFIVAVAALVALLSTGSSARAGTHTLTTFHFGNNGNDGNFFDVAATGGTALVIDQFDITVTTINEPQGTVEIWTRPGTHVGFTASSDGWTLVGSFANVPAGTNGIATVLGPLTTNVTVAAGQTQAFFIVVVPNNYMQLRYSEGTAVGALATSDSYLSIYEGTGATGTFGSATVAARTPPVTVHYTPEVIGPRWEVVAKVGGGNILNPFLPDYEPGAWSQKNVVVYLACVPGDAPIDLLRRDQSTLFRDGIHTFSTKPADVCIDENGLSAGSIVDWGPIMVDTVAPTCRITPSTQYVPRNTSGTAVFGLQITDATSGHDQLHAQLSQSGGAAGLSFGFDGELPPTLLYVTYDIGPSTAGRVTADLQVVDNAGNATLCRAIVRAK